MKESRFPPGQRAIHGLLVLHEGIIPGFDPQKWDFQIWGLVKEPVRLSYGEFRALPTVEVVADVHCVEGWSVLDTHWEGVPPKELLEMARPKPEARFVLVHCDGGYTTNLPLEALLDNDVLLAYRYEGEELTPEHGWPLRLVVPSRYFYKSAKWVRELEFLAEDRPGYWEQRGYHWNAGPWKEERFA